MLRYSRGSLLPRPHRLGSNLRKDAPHAHANTYYTASSSTYSDDLGTISKSRRTCHCSRPLRAPYRCGHLKRACQQVQRPTIIGISAQERWCVFAASAPHRMASMQCTMLPKCSRGRGKGIDDRAKDPTSSPASRQQALQISTAFRHKSGIRTACS